MRGDCWILETGALGRYRLIERIRKRQTSTGRFDVAFRTLSGSFRMV